MILLKKAFDFCQINRIIKNEISISVLLGVYLIIKFISYATISLANDLISYFINLFHLNSYVLPNISVSLTIYLLISLIFIQPILDFLSSRAIGIMYMEESDDDLDYFDD